MMPAEIRRLGPRSTPDLACPPLFWISSGSPLSESRRQLAHLNGHPTIWCVSLKSSFDERLEAYSSGSRLLQELVLVRRRRLSSSLRFRNNVDLSTCSSSERSRRDGD